MSPHDMPADDGDEEHLDCEQIATRTNIQYHVSPEDDPAGGEFIILTGEDPEDAGFAPVTR